MGVYDTLGSRLGRGGIGVGIGVGMGGLRWGWGVLKWRWGVWGGDWGGGPIGSAARLHLQAVPAHVPVNPNCRSKRGGGTWSSFELFQQRSRYNEPSPNCDCPLSNVQGEFEGEHIVIQCPDENDMISGREICDSWC